MLHPKKNWWRVYVTVLLLWMLFIPVHGGAQQMSKLSTFKSYDECWKPPL